MATHTNHTHDDHKVDEKSPELYTSVVDVEGGIGNPEYNEFGNEIDHSYFNLPPWLKFYRSCLFQMIMFGALSFVGPAMSDAISNLGGGGLSTPWLANLANSLNYTMGCIMTMFGGPVINKLGIKWSCLIAGISFVLAGSGYYIRARFQIDSYLLFARALGGVTSGMLYVAESSAMLSYPDATSRGLYLGIWAAMRNSGSVVGGGINFGTNYATATAGGIAWSTYLIFIGFECTGPIWALLLSQTRKVRRADGSKITMPEKSLTWAQEFRALGKHAIHKRTLLMGLPAFYSFFCGGVYGTYLSNHFSVRARALSSLITPTVSIVTVLLYGKILDTKRWSQKTRAWIALISWVVPQAMSIIWVGCIFGKYGTDKLALDYVLNRSEWAVAWIPYLIMITTCYWVQLSLYWMLGTFSTDVGSSTRTGGLFRMFETAGQAVSYGITSQASMDPRIPLYIFAALLAMSIPAAVGLIRLVPEKPSDRDDVVDDAPAVPNAVAKAEALAM